VRFKTLCFGVLVCGCLLASACGANGIQTHSSPSPLDRPPRPLPVTQQGPGLSAPGARVFFEKPKDGTTVRSTLFASVDVSGFELSKASAGSAARQGQGHLHFSLDGGKYDFPKYSGRHGAFAQMLNVQGKYSPSFTRRIIYRDIPPGQHTLVVYLANNDYTNTGVQASTTFIVR
jgi:hypothetical protein